MKKDSFYFPHDSNAKDDPKCVMLIEQLGLEGYGIYWVLVELLREQPDYRLPLSMVPALARRYNTTSQKMQAVISSYTLFEIEDDQFFFSQSLLNRMGNYEKIKEARRIAGFASARSRKLIKSTNAEQMLNKCSTNTEQNVNTVGTVFNIKEKKRKEESKRDSNNKGTPNSSNSPLKGVSLNSISRNIFEEYFKNVYGTDYYWSAKDSGGMSQLLKKLKFSREQKNLPLDDASMANALKSFLNNIENGWICENFSVSILASKYNEILSQIYKKVRNGKSNSQEQPTAREIAEQILANYEPNDAG